jgi:hypothetical protein
MALINPETVLPGTARRVEMAEANAWIDLFEAAPEEYAREQGLRLARVGEVAVMRSTRLPSPRFNRALGLGLREVATPGLVDRVLGLLREGGGESFLIQLAPAAQPEALPEWLAARGLQPRGAQGRMLREGGPLEPAPDNPRATLERVTAATAAEWAEVVDRAHGLKGVTLLPWLQALVARPGWFHFVLRRGGRAAAARSLYVHHDGMAWLGIEAGDGQDQLTHALVRAGLQAGADTFVADAAADDADAEGFRSLGFERLYRREGWGP